MSKERLSPRIIERVKDVANIVDVAMWAGVEIKRTGANYVALCPFHEDHNPSLFIDVKKNRYKCFACGEGGDPIRFVMAKEGYCFIDAVKYLAKKYGIGCFDYSCDVPSAKRTNKQVKEIPQVQTEFYDMSEVNKRQDDCNRESKSHFTSWLIKLGFSNDVIKQALLQYHVGVDSEGNSWFWQIDKNGNIHTALSVPFNPKTGHRLKEEKKEDLTLLQGRTKTWFLHDSEYKNMTRNMTDEEKSQVKKRFVTQCLFGEHLLYLNTRRVCIVESQKTAIIMSMIDGVNKTWLATGGKSNLSVEKLKVLEGRNVKLYPDVDAQKDWNDKYNEMKKVLEEKYNIKLTIHNVRNDVEQYMKEFLKVDELPKWARKFDLVDLELLKKGVWRP